MQITTTNLASSVKLTLLLSVACLRLAMIVPAQSVSDSASTNLVVPASLPARFGSCNVWAHDPSTILKENGEYWVFYTGRGIPSYHSHDLRTWTAGPRVFTNPPSWTTNAVRGFHGHFWAPDVIHVGDRYLLYYAISIFGRNTSAIGLATNPALDPDSPRYHWNDAGMVIECHTNDTFNTIDPAVTLDPTGRLWLAFGSFWSGIKLIQLDPATGKRISPDSPMYSLAHNSTIEASYIYRHDGQYYLFVNWGICCRGTNSTYEIRVGRSEQITGPYLDRAGKDMMDRGGTLFLQTDGPFIGPGHAGIIAEGERYWFSCHFYDGLQHGRQTLAIRPLKWGADGWPQIVD